MVYCRRVVSFITIHYVQNKSAAASRSDMQMQKPLAQSLEPV